MSLDVYQQVFLLSLASGAVNNYKGNQSELQESLQSFLEQWLSSDLPDWSVVWGPVVWKAEPEKKETGPENAWYIAYNPNLLFEDGSTHPAYVVGVAGTPTESIYAWFGENFWVNAVADFDAWVAGGITNRPEKVKALEGTYIAMGTVSALYTLVTTQSPSSAASPGTTLLDFFGNLGSRGDEARFITAGHSLGGALSPSLALTLVKSGALPEGRTLSYPCAGPSPGNGAFAALFSKTLPPRGTTDEPGTYRVWNRNLANALDIVPQAWCLDPKVSPELNLSNIPTLYGTPAIPRVNSLVRTFSILASLSGMLYVPLPAQIWSELPPSSTPDTIEEFLKIAGAQHVQVYLDKIGVKLPSLERDLFATKLLAKTAEEKLQEYPVIGDIEWAREHPEKTDEMINKVGQPACPWKE